MKHYPSDLPSADLSDPLLAEVIEQITRRLEAGEDVDLDVYQQKHPAQAQRLAELLPALRLVAGLIDEMPTDAHIHSPDDEALPFGTLGDFCLLREVGRGGMAVVYEAEQISLGRRVALKVLPFAATLDSRRLARFKNEALAAAHLDHAHIVPVLGVGCERGVHYYAMRLIDGRTLATVIADWRRAQTKAASTLRPGRTGSAGVDRDRLRTVAELTACLAGAIDHAHQHGIVHRDVKPANLMVDRDGKAWVTDFGLAQVQSDTRLTMTGDLMGTLRYMSPEQALAHRVPIDHRTDIYSLGVTLYELLTLRPAFAGADRQEVLRRIAFEEPVGPRRLDSAIPAELEVIASKAMAKSPAERYATAGEMADDLRSWLADRPIRARPPSFGQRLARWGRRHRTLVVATIVVLLLTSVGLACSTALIVAQQRKTKQALDSERESTRKAVDALDAEREAKQALQDALGRERQLGYGYSVGLAYRFWQDNDLSRARQLLDMTPPEMRGWEYDYLDRLVEVNGVTLSDLTIDPPRDNNWMPLPEHTWSFCRVGKTVSVRTTAGATGTWDTSTGQRLSVHLPQAPEDRALKEAESTHGTQRVMSLDGKRLFARSDDRILVLDPATGKTVQQMRGHTGRVTAFVLSSDGRTALSAGLDGAVILWDAGNGKQLLRCGPASGPVTAAWLAPGNRFVTLSFPGSNVGPRDLVTRLWNGHQRAPVPGGGDSVDARLTLWDANGKPAQTWPLRATRWRGDPWAVSFADDGKILAADVASVGDPQTLVFDTATGKEMRRFTGELCDLSQDGRRMLLGDRGRIVVEDLQEGKRLADVALPTGMTGRSLWYNRLATLSGDGKRFSVLSRNQTISVRDARTGMEIALTRGWVGHGIESVVLSHDGSRLLVAAGQRVVRVCDLQPGTQADVLAGQYVPLQQSPRLESQLSSDGRTLAFVAQKRDPLRPSNWNYTLVVLDTEGRSPPRVLALPTDARTARVGISPDRKQVAALAGLSVGRTFLADFRFLIWDLATGKPIACTHPDKERVIDFAFTPGGLRLVTAPAEVFPFSAEDRRRDVPVIVRDAATGRELFRKMVADAWVAMVPRGFATLKLSPDGSRLLIPEGKASTFLGRTWEGWGYGIYAAPATEVWEVETGKKIGRVQFDLPPTASTDRWVHLRGDELTELRLVDQETVYSVWDLRTCRQVTLRKLPGLRGRKFWNSLGSITIHPGGDRLLQFGPDLEVWDLKSGRQVLHVRDEAIHLAAFSPDGKKLYTVDANCQLKSWDGTPVDEAPPRDAKGANTLAWRVVSQDTRSRVEYTRARELALRVCELAPATSGYWNTLGVAEYRVGNYAAAIVALKKSVAMAGRSEPEDAFFLAMANAKLGLKDEAKKWFDAGVKRLGESTLDPSEANRFRAEAVRLLEAMPE